MGVRPLLPKPSGKSCGKGKGMGRGIAAAQQWCTARMPSHARLAWSVSCATGPASGWWVQHAPRHTTESIISSALLLTRGFTHQGADGCGRGTAAVFWWVATGAPECSHAQRSVIRGATTAPMTERSMQAQLWEQEPHC
jgi:hypothetical protein